MFTHLLQDIIIMQEEDAGENVHLTTNTGHYFLRYDNIGIPPNQKARANGLPHAKLSYPQSTIGTITYSLNGNKYKSFGCSVGRNLVMTVTPDFGKEEFVFADHEHFILSIIRQKHCRLYREEESMRYGTVEEELSKAEENQDKDLIQFLLLRRVSFTEEYGFESFDVDEYVSSLPSSQMEFTSWESMESHKVEEIYYPDINQILPKRFIPNLPLVSNQFAFLKVDTALDLQEKYGSLGLHFNLPHLQPHNYIEIGSGEGRVKEKQQVNGVPSICRIKKRIYLVGLSLKGEMKRVSMQLYENIQKRLLALNEKAQVIDQSLFSLRPSALRQIFQTQRRNLVYVHLRNCELERMALEKERDWKEWTNWVNLRHLILGRQWIIRDKNQMGVGMMRLLVKQHCPFLLLLSLSQTQLHDGHISTLVKAHWPTLRSINLKSNRLTTTSLLPFSKNRWDHLSGLEFGENRLGNEAVGGLLLIENKNILGIDLGRNPVRLRRQEEELLRRKFVLLPPRE